MTANTLEHQIRHIAVPLFGRETFATAEFEKAVTVWSLRHKTRLSAFETVLDFGGARLAFVNQEKLALVAARFHGPMEAYDIGGGILWSRQDLTGVQQIVPLAGEKDTLLGVALEDQPYRIISGSDGKDFRIVEGVQTLYPDPSSTRMLCVTLDKHVCLAESNLIPLWQYPLNSFAVLSAAFSAENIVFSEVGGPIVCLDLNGRKKWTLVPEKNHHFLRVAWNQKTRTWMGIDWDFEMGGTKRLYEINQTAQLTLVRELGEPAATEFFASGELLITSEGDVIESQSGQNIWQFF